MKITQVLISGALATTLASCNNRFLSPVAHSPSNKQAEKSNIQFTCQALPSEEVEANLAKQGLSHPNIRITPSNKVVAQVNGGEKKVFMEPNFLYKEGADPSYPQEKKICQEIAKGLNKAASEAFRLPGGNPSIIIGIGKSGNRYTLEAVPINLTKTNNRDKKTSFDNNNTPTSGPSKPVLLKENLFSGNPTVLISNISDSSVFASNVLENYGYTALGDLAFNVLNPLLHPKRAPEFYCGSHTTVIPVGLTSEAAQHLQNEESAIFNQSGGEQFPLATGAALAICNLFEFERS